MWFSSDTTEVMVFQIYCPICTVIFFLAAVDIGILHVTMPHFCYPRSAFFLAFMLIHTEIKRYTYVVRHKANRYETDDVISLYRGMTAVKSLNETSDIWRTFKRQESKFCFNIYEDYRKYLASFVNEQIEKEFPWGTIYT